MKKILFIMSSLSGGGAEKVLIDILNNFDYSEFQVDLFLENSIGVYMKDVPSEVNILSLYKKRTLFVKTVHRLLNITNLYTTYWKLIHVYCFKKKIGTCYDSIVSFMEGGPLKYHSTVINRAAKNITWIHIDLFSWHYTSSLMSHDEERKCYDLMDHLVFVSSDAKKAFRRLYNVHGEHHVVYNLIDRDKILKRSLQIDVLKQRMTVCSVGRLTEMKRYDRLIRVAKRFQEEGYELDFWILGEGELEHRLKQQCIELNVNERVHFLGFINPPYSYVKAADVFLSTSDAEGFPLVVCEALCLGAAIVSTKTTGPMEILDNSKYGILVDKDENAIYNGLKCLIDNPDTLAHYKKMALERSQIFDVSSAMSQIYAILK